ncbi:unnamed protein product, partial [Laminaria digitata]
MQQLDTVERINVGATGDRDTEAEEGTQQTFPQQEAGKDCAEVEKGEGVLQDANSTSSPQAGHDKPMVLDAEKSERDADPDRDEAMTRDRQLLTANGATLEEKKEGREAADGGTGEDG